VNQALERTIGRSASELIGRHVTDAGATERPHDAVTTLLHEIVNSEEPSRSESTLIARDGSRRHVVWHSTTLRSPAGEVEHIIVIGVDDTATRVLESQLEQSRRIESLGRVAATIAHEFNNVLMSIGPFAEVIRRGKGDSDAVRAAAERISASVQRGQRVTEEVMRFTRRAEPTLRPVDVDEWLRTFTADMSVVLHERTAGRVRIEIDAVHSLPRVSVDSAQLYQVLNNLVTNAADSMADGGGVVKIAARGGGQGEEPAPFDARSFVHLSVSDSGSGIPPETLCRIFEPFFTTKRSGTGIGLAAAHQMVTAFGGQIFAESEVNRGTTFHLYLRHAD
jgi:PAS domain S-box-containing protein